MNYQKYIITGRLTRDPELRSTKEDLAVCDFGIANNQKYKDKEKTLFLDCVAFGKRAESIADYFHKGDNIFLDGKLEQSSWETDEGEKRTKIKLMVDAWNFVDKKEM